MNFYIGDFFNQLRGKYLGLLGVEMKR